MRWECQERFSPPTSKETAIWRSWHALPHVRHARAVMHAGIANRYCREKRSQHSRCMRNPQVYASGKRPMVWNWHHFFSIAILHQPHPSDNINTRLQLSDTCSIPQMHAGVLEWKLKWWINKWHELISTAHTPGRSTDAQMFWAWCCFS